MKNSKYILIIIAVIILALVGLTKDKKNISVKQEPSIDICYTWNTEAGDSASLKMSFSGDGGSIVSGSFDFEPYQKDAKRGAFSGVALPLDQKTMSRTANVLWQASAEGVTNTEELYINFGEGNAAPAFGEMKDRGDGVYVYAYPENLSYPINLGQTDCKNMVLN